ncbi:hypothetical protein [Halomonas getboli]|uniref:hypothetical protein n=1 Tax=Halomonas getboli TaxID=2935862 RepID=UPI0020001D35|nr:hypothetical protein [Halomonas getboli]MCK2183228.1 hypothetical protein [Halomonas getboli]
MQQGRNILGLGAQPPGSRPQNVHDTITPSSSRRPAVTSGVMSVDLLTGRAMRWSRGGGHNRSGSDA